VEAREIALVVVRFAGDLLQITPVAADGRFRIGTAPGTDLATTIAGEFALVAGSERGFVVRCPTGVTARRDGLALDGAVLLRRGPPVVLATGWLTITITLEDAQPLARPPIERRPYVFGAASLVAHLAVWLLAMLWPAPPVPLPVLPGIENHDGSTATRVARYAVAAQSLRRDPRPPPPALPITTGPTPTPQPVVESTRSPGPRTPTPPGALGPAASAKSTPTREPREPISGQARRFDPTTRPDFDTVKSGPYPTLASGRAAGDEYELASRKSRMVVVSCDASSCIVVGGDEAAPIRRAIERRLADITACYENATGAAGRQVELDFDLDDDGMARGVKVGGVGDAGNCVANIIHEIQFSQ